MFEFLFIDLDDTVLDFQKAERRAIQKGLQAAGIDPTEEICARYSAINRAHWQMLERRELTRDQVLVQRFAVLFRELGEEADPHACAQSYMQALSQGHWFLPGALEALEQLSQTHRLFLASNGTAAVQRQRLKSADIGHLFEKFFISQDVGADKPDKAYFTRCFAQIPGFAPDRAKMIGDSLTSDIQGGKNAGIATCWVHPGHKECTLEVTPDYRIESLAQLPALLESLSP